MRRYGVAFGSVLVLLLTGTATAASASTVKQYVLPHPARERCKAHYFKRIEHGKTWCVRLKPTTTNVTATSEPGNSGRSPSILVDGQLWAGGEQLVNLTLQYEIIDETTGENVGSFRSRSDVPCTVVMAELGEAFTGETLPPYPACVFSRRVNVHLAHSFSIVASFAGNATYAPSASVQEPFG